MNDEPKINVPEDWTQDTIDNVFNNLAFKDRGLKTSKGSRKIWAFLEEELQKESLTNRLRELRQECRLPANGLTEEEAQNFLLNIRKDSAEWQDYQKIMDEGDRILGELDLAYDWLFTLEMYILTGKLSPESPPIHLVNIYDINYPPFTPPNKSRGKNLNGIEPILLGISPYASQREVVEYIKATYKSEIEPMQKWYQKSTSQIGKIRAKKPETAELYKLIEENMDKNNRAIQILVREKLHKIIGYNDISKIKGIIKRRRS